MLVSVKWPSLPVVVLAMVLPTASWTTTVAPSSGCSSASSTIPVTTASTDAATGDVRAMIEMTSGATRHSKAMDMDDLDVNETYANRRRCSGGEVFGAIRYSSTG